MKLSVIIVNYNVRAFLEQCLYSLQHALYGLEAEVWVVDNASTDQSVQQLRPVFPWVKWVENKTNEGFAKANNRVLPEVNGDYILFLNPDTLVPENCLRTCIDFLDNNPDAGATGVYMVDGSGNYLPESKRGNPGIFTSLCKLAGLHHVFPASGLFARYYMGHLPADKNNPVEVLAGAYIMIRKKVIDTVGAFDERFFMYGEDIDLSYRINRTIIPGSSQCWKTWYLADARIVHFKGESTKRGSLNYVILFYRAMIQFVQKHYASGPASLFRFFIYSAIVLRAILAAMVRAIVFAGKSMRKLRAFLNRKRDAAGGLNYISYTEYAVAYIIGKDEDVARVKVILEHNHVPAEIMKWEQPVEALIDALKKQDMIIWCRADHTTLGSFMDFMEKSKNGTFFFHYPGSQSIIGSTHKKKSGEVFLLP